MTSARDTALGPSLTGPLATRSKGWKRLRAQLRSLRTPKVLLLRGLKRQLYRLSTRLLFMINQAVPVGFPC